VKHADLVAALVWAGVGAGAAFEGWTLGVGGLHDPGPGFMLFGVGVIMGVLTLAVAVVAARGGEGAADWRWRDARWGKLFLVVAALVVYGVLLERLGFLVTTALVLLVLFKAVEAQRWWVAITGSVVSTLVAWLVFHVWLGAQLPRGLLDLG
jgi:putative tricarboxylic transport membrane protein